MVEIHRVSTMPPLLEHMAIAGLVALPLVKKPKWILAFIWVAILPDLDFFLGLHRIAFHSLIVLLPIITIVVGLMWKWLPQHRELALFVAFALLSHVFLDILQYWVALFWPLLPLAFWPNIQIRLISTGITTAINPMVAPLDVLFIPGEATIIGPFDLFLFLLFLTVTLIRIWPDIRPTPQSPPTSKPPN